MDEIALFREPTTIERWFNRGFGILTRLGIGRAHNYLLSVKGRISGRTYSTPVNLLKSDGDSYLVSPRGEAQWVLNIRNSNSLILKRGTIEIRCGVEEVLDRSKPAILKEYLSRYTVTVQRYFSVAPDAPLTEFEKIAERHPVFRLRADYR